jgi:hypothetical protein
MTDLELFICSFIFVAVLFTAPGWALWIIWKSDGKI